MFAISENWSNVRDPAPAIVILFVYLSLIGQPSEIRALAVFRSVRPAGSGDRKKHVKQNELPVRNRRTRELMRNGKRTACVFYVRKEISKCAAEGLCVCACVNRAYLIVGGGRVGIVYICVSKGKIARLIDFPIASRRLRTNAPCPVFDAGKRQRCVSFGGS